VAFHGASYYYICVLILDTFAQGAGRGERSETRIQLQVRYATIYVSSYYMCPHMKLGVLIYMCPHTVNEARRAYNYKLGILLYMCPHTMYLLAL